MPQMPDRGRSGFLQTEVPRATGPITAPGAAYGELSKLGGTIANVALALGEQQMKADAQQFITNTDTDDLLETNKFVQKERLNIGRDPEGFVKKVEQFTKDRFQKNLQNAPNNMAKDAYTRSASNFFNRTLIDARGFAGDIDVKIKDFDLKDGVDKVGRNLVDIPDKALAIEQMGQFDKAFDGYVGSVYDQVSAEKGKKWARNKLAKDFFIGSINNKQYNNALSELRVGKDGTESPLSAALTPEEKNVFQDQIMRKLESDKEQKTIRTMHKAQSMVSRALSLGDITESDYKSTLAAANRVRDLVKREELVSNIEAAYYVQSKLNNAKSLKSKDVIKDLVESVKTVESELLVAPKSGDKFLNFDSKQKMVALYSQGIKNLLEKRDKNGMEEVLKDPKLNEEYLIAQKSSDGGMAMREFLSKTDAAQLALGIRPDKVRKTTDEQLSILAQELAVNENDPIKLNLALSRWQTMYGKDFNRVLLEGVKHDKKIISKEYLPIAYFSNDSDRQSFLRTVTSKAATESDYSKSSKYTADEVKRHLGNALQDIKNSFLYSGIIFDEAFTDAAELQMKREILDGKSLKQAETRIKEMFFSNNFSIAQSRSSFIAIPKNSGIKPEIVESFLKAYDPPSVIISPTKVGGKAGAMIPEMEIKNTASFSKLMQSEFRPYPSPKYVSELKEKFPGISDAQIEDIFINQTVAKSRWVSTQDGSGLRLVHVTVPGTEAPLLDKKGDPIVKTLQEIGFTNDPNVLKPLAPIFRIGR